MMFFWVIAVLLILAALLFVIPSLLQRSSDQDEGVARSDLNVAVYQDQLEELASDLENGLIDKDQYEIAKADLERNLIEGNGNIEEGASQPEGSGKLPVLVVAIAVPVLAVALYGKVGGGEHAFSPEKAPMEVENGDHSASIEEMVASLEARLDANPDDVEGWAMLGRSYYFMKRFGDAVTAYEKSLSLGGASDAVVLADFADAYAMANGRTMAGRPYELVKQALRINPTHEKSLWLAGTAAYQMEDFRGAIGYWERLLVLFEPSSDNWKMIQNNINELKTQLGEPVTPMPAAVASVAEIKGVARISPELASKASPNDTVFVFARAISGPRMPLAIVRKQVKDLPFEFTLNDSMAMNPAFKLSSFFPQVEVGVRISKSGQAMPQSGDLEGVRPASELDGEGKVVVTVTRQLP